MHYAVWWVTTQRLKNAGPKNDLWPHDRSEGGGGGGGTIVDSNYNIDKDRPGEWQEQEVLLLLALAHFRLTSPTWQ